MYPDVDFYTTTRYHRKTVQKLPRNAKKQQPTENKNNTEYRNLSQMGTRFLHLACQCGCSHP